MCVGGLAVPGPDFFTVVRMSAIRGRYSGILCGLGVSLGVTIWGWASFLGARILIKSSGSITTILESMSAFIYLIIGIYTIYSSTNAASIDQDLTSNKVRGSAFFMGLVTNIMNFKGGLFVVFLFSSIIPMRELNSDGGFAFVIFLGMITACWYFTLALVCSHTPVRQKLMANLKYFDLCSGSVFILFALFLISSLYSK
ncbi:LysE family translocator [Acetobacter pasteurianus]|uniref:LysE family translocator n=1 Tax=Acetobacter pasteurianus TaxID=438 RepID=UPI0024933FAC|nr:LysE family translocator [Acetobacter pasteurianus]